MSSGSAFGERLRQTRKRRLLTQQELATRASLRWQTISALETGKQLPRLRTIRALATALEVPASELTGEAETQHR